MTSEKRVKGLSHRVIVKEMKLPDFPLSGADSDEPVQVGPTFLMSSQVT